MHWLLYLLLFVIPILGWINASWRGMPVVMFGLELPKLVATRAPGWGWTGDVHGLLANYLMLALVGLHVAAALYHYFLPPRRRAAADAAGRLGPFNFFSLFPFPVFGGARYLALFAFFRASSMSM